MSCCMVGFRSSIVLEWTCRTTANFENWSMQVRKNFLSVEKMSIWRLAELMFFWVPVVFGFCACFAIRYDRK